MFPTHISSQMLLNQLPIYIFWKDMESQIVGGNELFIQAAGFNSPEDIKGKSDFQMPWAQFADEYRRFDAEVLRGHHLEAHHELSRQASGELVKIIVNKKPIYNDHKKILGLIGYYTIEKILNSKLTDQIVKLPRQQKECLRLLTHGKSVKQIAQQMQLSPRTIEFYLRILKDKLQCKNTSELIVNACNFYAVNTP